MNDMFQATQVWSRTWQFVSCWHMNDVESSAMWSQYDRSGQGLAIRTTFRRFRGSFKDDKPVVNGGKILYLDYDTPTTGPRPRHITQWSCTKRRSFEHEREFRGIVFNEPNGLGPPVGLAPVGISVPVDVNTLIQDIFISPTAPRWVSDLIRRVLIRYSLDVPVQHSTLNENPPYLTPVSRPAHGLWPTKKPSQVSQ